MKKKTVFFSVLLAILHIAALAILTATLFLRIPLLQYAIALPIVVLAYDFWFIVRTLRAYQKQLSLISQTEKNDTQKPLTARDKLVISIHESGHAVVATASGYGDRVPSIFTFDRHSQKDGEQLGYITLDESPNSILSKDELMDNVCIYIAGRCVEELMIGEIFNSAGDDLDVVIGILNWMIKKDGMSDIYPNHIFPGEGNLKHSPETQTLIDWEIQTKILTCKERARQLLELNKDILEEMSKYLLEHGKLEGEDLKKILAKVKTTAKY